MGRKHSMCNGEMWSAKPVEFLIYFSLPAPSRSLCLKD